ncbi:MAG: hypothetical protein IKF71_03650 [Bacilli bacterium]|nr:hypothetical protein [Bacilli bacterium]
MNNYCRNCGEKLTNSSVCEKCGTKILTDRVGELDRLLAKKYIKIFFTMFILCFMNYVVKSMLPDADVLYALISPIISFLPLALIIFVIFAKKKLKYSKFFNIVFWIMLLLIILLILFILFMLISCEYRF